MILVLTVVSKLALLHTRQPVLAVYDIRTTLPVQYNMSDRIQYSILQRQCEVKALFRKLVEDYGGEFTLAEIKPDADIVLNKHFENGISKIQACNEEALSHQEKAAVKVFLRPTTRGEASVEENEDET